MKKPFNSLFLLAALMGTASPLFAQTIVGNTADAQVEQGSPNIVTATGATQGVGYGGSSGAMGQNVVFVFALPTVASGFEIAAADFSLYYETKDLSGPKAPDYNGDLYGLGYRIAPGVQVTDFFKGTLDTSAALIQDDFIPKTVGSNGAQFSTSNTAVSGGDAKLKTYLNAQLRASAADRAAGKTAYAFLRVNPDSFGNTYTRFKFYSAENSSFYQPKLTLSTVKIPPRFFSSTSFWNAPITNAPLATDQSDVQKLVNQVHAGSPYWGNTWINTTQYSTPVYSVPANAPTVAVTDTDDGFMTSVWGQVPWPSTASPAAGTDKHLVIYQPSSDTLWEFFGAGGTYPNPTATHGGKMSNVSTSNGVFPRPYGATATGLPLVGGLITLDEARQVALDPNYTIPHAIALSVTSSFPDPQYFAPATRADQYSNGTVNSIQEGRRFRLPPTFDVETQMASKPRLTKAIARAVKQYGMVVRDVSGAVSLYGEDPKTLPTAENPWPSAFNGTETYAVISENYFPWHLLQVIQP